jgi:hypothetical protein
VKGRIGLKMMGTRWGAGLLTMAMSLFLFGRAQSKDSYPLTSELVARTLSERGAPLTEGQVTLLANVVSTAPNPSLDVLAVTPLVNQWPGMSSEGRSLLRLACHQAGQCLPFYAVVIWTMPAIVGKQSMSPSAGAPNVALKAANAVTMRAGTHATLIMDSDRSHIQVAVITLENGAVGRRIRVTSPDRKQIYTGEVVSATLLKGSF